MKRYDISLLKSLLKDADKIKNLALKCYDDRLDRAARKVALGTDPICQQETGTFKELDTIGISDSKELFQTIRAEIRREFNYLFKIFEVHGTKVLTHEIVHVRIEFLLQVMNFVFEVRSFKLCIIDPSLNPIIE